MCGFPRFSGRADEVNLTRIVSPVGTEDGDGADALGGMAPPEECGADPSVPVPSMAAPLPEEVATPPPAPLGPPPPPPTPLAPLPLELSGTLPDLEARRLNFKKKLLIFNSIQRTTQHNNIVNI